MNTNIPFSELKDYELIDKAQDIRGWPVKDGSGSSLGTVKDMLVDTQQERVTTLVLDSGKSVAASDVMLGDHVVMFGTNGRATAATAGTSSRPTGTAAATGDQVVPVIDEFMRVGKREVGTGNVKVSTHVVSRPVEENVTLRQEHVSVERRPVNRDVSAADVAGMRDRSIEMTARSEEAVVAKVARVVEEIVLRKDVTQKTQTIRDTVKHTEVEVDDGVHAQAHQQHFDAQYATTGATYDQYTPAYKFGQSMRQDSRFAGNTWNDVEPKARTAWEEKNPGTWESFKEAVQHAWMKVSGS